MTSRSGLIYRVQLTAFSEKDSPLPPLRGNIPTQGVMVISIGPLDDKSPERDGSYANYEDLGSSHPKCVY